LYELGIGREYREKVAEEAQEVPLGLSQGSQEGALVLLSFPEKFFLAGVPEPGLKGGT
jgi:hypothetical protein